MAATASGRQAWRQLMRNSCRGPATPSNLLRQQHRAFTRQASSTTQSSSRRVVTQSPSSFLRQQQFAQRSYSSGSQGHNTPPRSNSQVKFWPFLIVIAFGSGGYILLANRRKSEFHTHPRKI
jgi:UMP-CMP kinase